MIKYNKTIFKYNNDKSAIGTNYINILLFECAPTDKNNYFNRCKNL